MPSLRRNRVLSLRASLLFIAVLDREGNGDSNDNDNDDNNWMSERLGLSS